jgi:hypothetical protein
MANTVNLTVWTSVSNLQTLLDWVDSALKVDLDNEYSNSTVYKSVLLKNATSWAVVRIWSSWRTPTATDWFSLEYKDTISFSLIDIRDVNLISDTASTEVERFIK